MKTEEIDRLAMMNENLYLNDDYHQYLKDIEKIRKKSKKRLSIKRIIVNCINKIIKL